MSGKNKLFMISTIILILFSLISCSSKEERRIILQIQKNGFVDLSMYCSECDEIIIYDEGYYCDYDDNQWPGTKIYYFNKGNIKKIINLHYCADIPIGTVIHFSDYNNGKIKQNRENAVFYLSHIVEYKSGKILQLNSQKTNIQTWSFK